MSFIISCSLRFSFFHPLFLTRSNPLILCFSPIYFFPTCWPIWFRVWLILDTPCLAFFAHIQAISVYFINIHLLKLTHTEDQLPSHPNHISHTHSHCSLICISSNLIHSLLLLAHLHCICSWSFIIWCSLVFETYIYIYIYMHTTICSYSNQF